MARSQQIITSSSTGRCTAAHSRTLKTLQNRSRVSSTKRLRTQQAKTGTRKQHQAGEYPARDPPGTSHHCVRANTTPRVLQCAGCTDSHGCHIRHLHQRRPPHTRRDKQLNTRCTKRAVHHLSHLAASTASGSPVLATAATLLHAFSRAVTQRHLTMRHSRKRTRPGGQNNPPACESQNSGNKKQATCPQNG